MVEKNHLLLFLSAENFEHATFAESLFNTEAQKLDLLWNSSTAIDFSRFLQIQDGADSKIADLIVVLVQSEQAALIKDRCKGWTGPIEFWNLESDADMQSSIQREINSLVIRLILKGGKRKALAPPPGDKSTKQAPPGTNRKSDVIRVTLDKKRRKGKVVTVASGFSLDQRALEELAAELKKHCGSGGTFKDAEIEIQGDHRSRLVAELERRGYRCKKIGF